jgi:hypothetical protein
MTNGPEQPTAPITAGPPPQQGSDWSAGRILGVVFASIGGLIGLAFLLAGIAAIAAYAFGRDDDGYFTTDREQLESATYAISTEEIDLGADEIEWAPDGILGDVRIEVDGGERPVFVGIGPDDQVDRYLRGVRHDELTGFDGDDPEFVLHEGRRPRTPPGEQGFWVAETEGAGDQSLTWDADFGRWTAVVMNAEAARGIDVEADVGVKVGWVIWAGLGLLVIGLVMTVGAVVVILLVARRASRSPG